ncbi:MAG: hypothetical protein XD79_0650 [Atribacteria bacterium 34_128]|nr:MAG: hypothetical protein XD79_0650 [Atribacteria bacterium 34_128]
MICLIKFFSLVLGVKFEEILKIIRKEIIYEKYS